MTATTDAIGHAVEAQFTLRRLEQAAQQTNDQDTGR